MLGGGQLTRRAFLLRAAALIGGLTMLCSLGADVLDDPRPLAPSGVKLGAFTYDVHYRVGTDDWIHVARIVRVHELWSYTEVTAGPEPSAGFSERALKAIRDIWNRHA